MGKVMTPLEQSTFTALYKTVEAARDLLEATEAGRPDRDEDLRVACARLDNWLEENYGRWTK